MSTNLSHICTEICLLLSILFYKYLFTNLSSSVHPISPIFVQILVIFVESVVEMINEASSDIWPSETQKQVISPH